jgi:hypothetical protein
MLAMSFVIRLSGSVAHTTVDDQINRILGINNPGTLHPPHLPI